MSLDILLFAVVAAVLIFRLKSLLGTRHGDERSRPNPYAVDPNAEKETRVDADAVHAPGVIEGVPLDSGSASEHVAAHGNYIGVSGEAAEDVMRGLSDIRAADGHFDVPMFVDGAKAAFEMVVTAFYHGDRVTLKDLLSPKLYADFEAGITARESRRQTADVRINAITAARIIEAKLLGVMAYVTIDFDVSETVMVRDEGGNIVEGGEDSISVRDIWVFARDVRAGDPNWLLIETRT